MSWVIDNILTAFVLLGNTKRHKKANLKLGPLYKTQNVVEYCPFNKVIKICLESIEKIIASTRKCIIILSKRNENDSVVT